MKQDRHADLGGPAIYRLDLGCDRIGDRGRVREQAGNQFGRECPAVALKSEECRAAENDGQQTEGDAACKGECQRTMWRECHENYDANRDERDLRQHFRRHIGHD